MTALFQSQPWAVDALCAQTDPDAFFPEKGGGTKEAKATCAACLVRTQCLDYAISTNERHGVWGGKSEHQRRGLRSTSTPAPFGSAAA